MTLDATFDACVLHPAGLRDLLVRLAMTGLFRAHWSEQILDEMVMSILRRRPDLSASQLDRTRELMCEAVPDCIVVGHDDLTGDLRLPDPADRHVLAAAIHSNSQVIVTENLRDFPSAALGPFGIEAQTPDSFVLALVRRSPRTVHAVVRAQAASLRNPPMNLDEVLDRLVAAGLRRTVAALRAA